MDLREGGLKRPAELRDDVDATGPDACTHLRQTGIVGFDEALSLCCTEVSLEHLISRPHYFFVALDVNNVCSLTGEEHPVQKLATSRRATPQDREVFRRKQNGRDSPVKIGRGSYGLSVYGGGPPSGTLANVDANRQLRVETDTGIVGNELDASADVISANESTKLRRPKRSQRTHEINCLEYVRLARAVASVQDGELRSELELGSFEVSKVRQVRAQ